MNNITIGQWLSVKNLDKFNDKTFYFDYSNRDSISVIVLPKQADKLIQDVSDDDEYLGLPTAEELIEEINNERKK